MVLAESKGFVTSLAISHTQNMPQLSRSEVLETLKAFQERRGDEVSPQTKTSLDGMLLAAAKNEGTEKGLKFTRAYQASFDVTTSGQGPLKLQPAELSSFLRLDLGDGEAPIAPSQGLISGIFAVQPKLMGQLDIAAIGDAAKTSVATGAKTRVNLSTEGSDKAIAEAIESHPEAKLVGEIVLGDRRPPTPETAVAFAKSITGAGAEFALSNVVDGNQLSTMVGALKAEGLTPSSADMDFSIGRDLGQSSEAGQKAFATAKDIFSAAKDSGVDVAVGAIAMGTPAARSALFSAAKEADFAIDKIRLSGRDLMPETIGLGTDLPTPSVEQSTGIALGL